MFMIKHGARRRRGASLALSVLALAVVVSGCTSDTSTDQASPAASSSSEGSQSSASAAPGESEDPAGIVDASAATMPVPEAPGDAALQLEALYGQHAVLATDMMRGRLRGDDDYAQTAASAVSQNSANIAAMVAAVGGDEAAETFSGLWSRHTSSLANYARGLATDDETVTEEARTALIEVGDELGQFVGSATADRLPSDAARDAVHVHEQHLLDMADAYKDGDYEASNAAFRTSYDQAFGLGDTLAKALLPDSAKEFATPKWQLRSGMTKLLGEHVGLALATLRAGATGAPDFEAAIGALNGNTADVTAAVSSLFGEEAGAQFTELWADHLDLVGNYAADVGAGRDARRDEVAADLKQWQVRFGEFMDTATEGRVPSEGIAAAFLGLDDLLLSQVDAFAAGDYQRANQIAAQVYPQVFGLSKQLADAFGATVAGTSPAGGAQTGYQPGRGATDAFRSARPEYSVAAPSRVRIPDLGVNASVERLGRAADGSVEVPQSYHTTGWFEEGARPGQQGPAVILGHVNSRTGPGVFADLKQLSAGDVVLVDRADGSTARFRVSEVLQVPKTQFPTERVYGANLRATLRLVTCGGIFDDAAGSHQDNVIVFAELVS